MSNARHQIEIHFDRDMSRLEVQSFQKRGNGRTRFDLMRLSVDDDFHGVFHSKTSGWALEDSPAQGPKAF